MNDWKPEKYIKVVKDNPFLQEYIEAELNYLVKEIENPKDKTFVDVGAGYGRVIPNLAEIGRNVLAVEIDKNMLAYLKKEAVSYPNVSVIEGDAQGLSTLLKGFDVVRPVVICIQNTLGTPYGDAHKIVLEMAEVAKNNGELIISLFAQEGLKDYGIPIYKSIAALSGEPDLEKTDFTNGNFISKTGYKSHWWKPEEREKIVKTAGGVLVSEVKGKYFYLFHVRY